MQKGRKTKDSLVTIKGTAVHLFCGNITLIITKEGELFRVAPETVQNL